VVRWQRHGDTTDKQRKLLLRSAASLINTGVKKTKETAIRQNIPTKASVEAETPTIINKKGCFFNEFSF